MNIIVRLLRFFWSLLDGVRKVLHLTLLLLLFAIVIAAVSSSIRTPVLPATAALVIAPQGTLVEQYSDGPLDHALAQVMGNQMEETRLRDIVDAIRSAKSDPHIKLLVLNLDELTAAGIAKLDEIIAAIGDFKKSGKQVIAYGQAYDQQQYYLAAQADQVYLDPHGMVLLDGFAYYRQYYKDAIDKLGITVNVFKAGRFKSYAEQYTRNDMSSEDREASNVWLKSLWNTYQNNVVKARGLGPNAVQDYADQLATRLQSTQGDFAKLALQDRLVSDLKTAADMDAQLKDLVGEDEDSHSYNQIDVDDYLKVTQTQRALHNRSSNKIGVIVAEGEIVDGKRTTGTVGGDSMVELLRKARFDNDVKAVVLRINSPGGSVMASELIRREVEELKKAGKPVIASMSSVAASGGYYIAMDADEIIADPATITGSIGVFSIVPTFDHTLGKLGINTDGLGTTSIAGAMQLSLPLNENLKKILQLSVDHEYAQFVGHVAQSRNKSFDDIDNIAQGRVWAANDARSVGLIDQVGLLQDAINAAAKRARLGKDYRVDYVEGDMTWRFALAEQVSLLSARVARALVPDASLMHVVPPPLSVLQKEMNRLSRYASKPQAYYYCACEIE
ncbi:MAG: signal peptide peptidase SppA [Steroidobacter sp.]